MAFRVSSRDAKLAEYHDFTALPPMFAFPSKVVLFLKAIKNQSGYYLAGNPPRWHKWDAAKPAPADAHVVVDHKAHIAAVEKLKNDHHLYVKPFDDAKAAAEKFHAEVHSLGSEIANQKNALARLQDVKKKVLAGKKPQPNEVAWFWKAPKEKRDEAIAAMQASANPDSAGMLALVLAAEPKVDGAPSVPEKTPEAAEPAKVESAPSPPVSTPEEKPHEPEVEQTVAAPAAPEEAAEPTPEQPAVAEGNAAVGAWPVKHFKHTKLGHDLWAVPVPASVGYLGKDKFKEVSEVAHSFGGNYSVYAKDGAIKGFHFKSPAKAQEFAAKMAAVMGGGDPAAAVAESVPAALPEKPVVSSAWQEAVDDVEAALKQGDTGKLDILAAQSKGLLSASAVHQYALAALAHLGVETEADAGEAVVSESASAPAAVPEAAAAPAAKPAKLPAAVKKLQQIDSSEVDAWLSNPPGSAGFPGADAKFWGLVGKASSTKFHKWLGWSKQHAVGHWGKTYFAAAVASLFGQHDKVLMDNGEFVPAKSVPVSKIENVVLDVATIKAAALAYAYLAAGIDVKGNPLPAPAPAPAAAGLFGLNNKGKVFEATNQTTGAKWQFKYEGGVWFTKKPTNVEWLQVGSSVWVDALDKGVGIDGTPLKLASDAPAAPAVTVSYANNQYAKNADGNWFNTATGQVFSGGGSKSAALSIAAGESIAHIADGFKDHAVDLAVELGGVSPAKALALAWGSGPKEGDIKTVGNVQYVLKNGRWHKMGDDEKSPSSGWSFTAVDHGFDGNPSISFETSDGMVYVVKGHDGDIEVGKTLDGSPGAPEYEIVQDAAAAVAHMVDKGWVKQSEVPSAEQLQKLFGASAAAPETSSQPAPAPAPAPAHPIEGLEVPDGILAPMAVKLNALKEAALSDGHAAIGVVVSKHFINVTNKNTGWKKKYYNPEYFAPHSESEKKQLQFILSAKALAGGSVNKMVAEWLGEKGYPVADKKNPPKVKSVSSASVAAPAPKVDPKAPESADGWKQYAGQGGYNEGGYYTDQYGEKWYCKFPSGGEDVVKNEILALKLYEAAGCNVPSAKLIKMGGKVGMASKIVDGLAEDKALLKSGGASAIFSGFAADCWLANWDAVGNNPAAGKGFDNIQFTPDGKAFRIDAGGSMFFKGTGAKKPASEFSDAVGEIKTMRSAKKNANTAAAFSGMSDSDVRASVAHVLAISDDKIKSLVAKFGGGSSADRDVLVAKLLARKADLASQFPDVAAKVAEKELTGWIRLNPGEKVVESGEKHGVKWAKVEMPPAGFNPSSIPKNGKYSASSKPWVNEANTADMQMMYDTATAGATPDQFEGLAFDEIEKQTGEKTGNKVSFTKHPAAPVATYFGEVLAELKAQLKPTYKILHSGSLAGAMSKIAGSIARKFKSAKYAAFKGWKDKAADYLVLDRSGGAEMPMPEVGMFKELSAETDEYVGFKQKCSAAFSKLTSSQQSACKSYTGSAYDDWNKAMRQGDTESSHFLNSKPMRDAFDGAAQEMPDGVIFWRGIGVGADTYKGVVGSIIQDGSFQSASYGSRPAFSSYSTWLRLHVGKGVKGINATTFSKFGNGEREVIVDRNVRYVVMSVEDHDNFVDSSGVKHGKKTIVNLMVLPHDPAGE